MPAVVAQRRIPAMGGMVAPSCRELGPGVTPVGSVWCGQDGTKVLAVPGWSLHAVDTPHGLCPPTPLPWSPPTPGSCSQWHQGAPRPHLLVPVLRAGGGMQLHGTLRTQGTRWPIQEGDPLAPPPRVTQQGQFVGPGSIWRGGAEAPACLPQIPSPVGQAGALVRLELCRIGSLLPVPLVGSCSQPPLGMAGSPSRAGGEFWLLALAWREPRENGVAGRLICARSAGMWMCWLWPRMGSGD